MTNKQVGSLKTEVLGVICHVNAERYPKTNTIRISGRKGAKPRVSNAVLMLWVRHPQALLLPWPPGGSSCPRVAVAGWAMPWVPRALPGLSSESDLGVSEERFPGDFLLSLVCEAGYHLHFFKGTYV